MIVKIYAYIKASDAEQAQAEGKLAIAEDWSEDEILEYVFDHTRGKQGQCQLIIVDHAVKLPSDLVACFQRRQ